MAYNVGGDVVIDEYGDGYFSYIYAPGTYDYNLTVNGWSYLWGLYISQSNTADGYIQIGENYIYGANWNTMSTFQIAANGNDSFISDSFFGLGMTTPSCQLDVSGDINIGGGALLINNIPYIEPSGNLQINTSIQNAIQIYESSGNSGYTYMRFLNTTGSTQYGSIYRSFSSMVYGTSSDYRLKENVVDLTGASERLQQIPVKRFNFIEHPERTVDGFLAHEVQAIVPEAVVGEKDELDDEGNPAYQSIDQSKLVPLLTAALQEALTEIENLKEETQSLKNRLDNLESN
jgi:hypothetical protein